MYPIFINTGKLNVYTYGLFVGIGFMTAIWVSENNAAFHCISPQTITDIFFVILISAVFGSFAALFIYLKTKGYKIWKIADILSQGIGVFVFLIPLVILIKHSRSFYDKKHG